MYRGTLPAVAALVTGMLLSACGHDLHASPTGLAEHQPDNTAAAPANHSGGTCTLLTSDQIQAATGGTVSAAHADNLTAGLDRCNWIITGGRLPTKTVELTAYRPINAHAPNSRVRNSALKSVPQLGAAASFDPATLTLTTTTNGIRTSWQIIAPARIKLRPASVLSVLTRLVKQA